MDKPHKHSPCSLLNLSTCQLKLKNLKTKKLKTKLYELLQKDLQQEIRRVVPQRRGDGAARAREESGQAVEPDVYRDLRRRDGRLGRAARRDGRLYGAGQERPPGRTGLLPLHAGHPGRDRGGRVRLPEAGARRPRAVRPPARGRHDQGQYRHPHLGARRHRVDPLRRCPPAARRRHRH